MLIHAVYFKFNILKTIYTCYLNVLKTYNNLFNKTLFQHYNYFHLNNYVISHKL